VSSAASELFKAVYIVAMGACALGLLRLALLERLDAPLKLAVGSFLVLMLLPTTYLYLRLAFPAASEAVLPFQSMAIWVYGPLLLTVLHLTSHQRMRRWHFAGYLYVDE
jgi:hypothetical protein